MAQQPSFSSNNPFRRKGPVAPAPPSVPLRAAPPSAEAEASSPEAGTAPALPARDLFWSQPQALPPPSQPPPPTSFQKPKVVKKVRVQSPPPSSPESSEVSDQLPPALSDDDESSSSADEDERADPFGHPSSAGSANRSERRDGQQLTLSHRPPLNPFQLTRKSPERGMTEPLPGSSTSSGTRNALDVGAFGRLLLTGQVGDLMPPAASPNAHLPLLGSDGASNTDASSVSRQSVSDTLQPVQETPRTSHEVSEHEVEGDRRRLASSSQSSLQRLTPTIVRKKPPPPSSRHGKLIKAGSGSDGGGSEGVTQLAPSLPLSSPARRSVPATLESPSRQRPPTPSDVNKPLPPAPLRSPAEVETDSVFDCEAAGKVPELEVEPGLDVVAPRPPTPPNVSHASSITRAATSQPQPSRKPAPPPRRQPHGRSDSKATLGAAADDTDSSLRRSSLDSTRSRSSSLRVSVHAPAPPPPPRRPGHSPRAPSSSDTVPATFASPGSEKRPAEAATPAKTATAEQPSPLSGGPITASPPPFGNGSSGSNTLQQVAANPTSPSTSSTTSSSHQPPRLSKRPPPRPDQAKLSPAPPPPPARNASVRAKRVGVGPPTASHAMAGSSLPPPSSPPPTSPSGSRKASAGSAKNASRAGAKDGFEPVVSPVPPPPPPPPPSRQKGRAGNRGSWDGAGRTAPAPGSSGGGGGGGVLGGNGNGNGIGDRNGNGNVNGNESLGGAGPLVEEPAVVSGSEPGPASASAAGDILADLSALQREVDALRGRYENEKERTVGQGQEQGQGQGRGG